ncbi:hypothetical protein MML48_4g00012375 [Holotrichia oblita]|uniref:Uncharacterized protein n=1 Tax=Holotrichia oblita TaxID=644536 RepID=A0ACB9T6V8_HOLOL|nr:hypothetical protein MML48_4g00012375 [Holotrichia oblita]
MSARNSQCSLQTDVNLVEQILEQGQRLRAAMVQTILNNDPFNLDLVKTQNFKSYSETDALKPMHAINADNQRETKSLSLEDKHKFLAYLRGEKMTRNDERQNMKLAAKSKKLESQTGVSYSYPSHSVKCLKYVDSLKISIHSLVLNQEGNKKVYGNSLDKKLKLPISITHTYFIEYQIPEIIMKAVLRSKSKVDSGLDSHNLVRMCSKKLHNEAIYFKQISQHDIANLDDIDLAAVNIKFQISCRTLKQKSSNILGCATFNLASFLNSKHLSLNQTLLVMLNNEVPIVIGTLKVSLQLGCGQLYFGKEFIDAIYSNKENIKNTLDGENSDVPSETKHQNTEVSLKSPKDSEFCDKNYEVVNKKNLNSNRNTSENTTERLTTTDISPVKETKKKSLKILPKQNFNKEKILAPQKILTPDLRNRTLDTDLPVIGCDRLEPICNPLNGEIYGQVEILVALGTDIQVHNLKLERGFESESVTSKSPRLNINKIPTDRSSPPTQSHINHKNLKILKKPPDINKQEQTYIISTKSDTEESPVKKNQASRGKFTNANKKPTRQRLKPKQNLVDVAIQSDHNMTDPQGNKNLGLPPTSDVLGAFLTQLLQHKQKNYVENSTNTDNKQIAHEQNNVQENIDGTKIRKTSDLLDSLQQALSINNLPQIPKQTSMQNVDTFKAHIVVENALHLPSTKKCKARIVQGKPRFEELLPSPFVSFETSSGLKVTDVVQENKNPEWDYNCEVELPADLLTNNQKRLIFKIWKKLLNAPPFEPNLESDTILGFAALDLTVLLAGMPTVSGWFNIVDFSNKCNGQIKISVTPLENLNRFKTHDFPFLQPQSNPSASLGINKVPQKIAVEKVDEPGELLSRALKRKFTELDEITQRLKLRLSHVTNDESDNSNDDAADEFERDINTLCVEEDYDMINFETETSYVPTQNASHALLQINSDFMYDNRDETPMLSLGKNVDNYKVTSNDEIESNVINMNSITTGDTGASSLNIDSSERNVGYVNQLDKQLMEGRQKIDSLLEKLSLLNHNEAEIFDNRYVSGCSAKLDASKLSTDNILKDIGKDVDPISTDVSSENNSSLNLHTEYVNKKPFEISSSTSSNSGLLTQHSEFRLAPDGAGNTPEIKLKPSNTVVSSSDT